MAGKKGRSGGSRKGAGRKAKADEERVRSLCLDAIEDVFGSEEDAFKHIAEEAKQSFPHLKLLMEYGYGKPKETLDLNTDLPKPPKKVFTDFGKDK